VSRKLLERKIAELGQGLLTRSGFHQKGPLNFERELSGLVQGIEFLPGSGNRRGLFTVNLYWRFTHSPIANEDAMDFWQRLGVFLGGADEWYGTSREQLDEVMPRLGTVFLDRVLPFFDRFQSVQDVLSAYEAGDVAESMLFGVDAGWREYNIGFTYLMAGRLEKAAEHLRIVLDRYSTAPTDWVQERRRVVETTLLELAPP
jgi:hypothetical protein